MSLLMKEFLEYAKREFDVDIVIKKSDTPDTFESLFGVSFIKQNDSDNNSSIAKKV